MCVLFFGGARIAGSHRYSAQKDGEKKFEENNRFPGDLNENVSHVFKYFIPR